MSNLPGLGSLVMEGGCRICSQQKGVSKTEGGGGISGESQ